MNAFFAVSLYVIVMFLTGVVMHKTYHYNERRHHKTVLDILSLYCHKNDSEYSHIATVMEYSIKHKFTDVLGSLLLSIFFIVLPIYTLIYNKDIFLYVVSAIMVVQYGLILYLGSYNEIKTYAYKRRINSIKQEIAHTKNSH